MVPVVGCRLVTHPPEVVICTTLDARDYHVSARFIRNCHSEPANAATAKAAVKAVDEEPLPDAMKERGLRSSLMEAYAGQQFVGIDLHVRHEAAQREWVRWLEVRLMPEV
jgi:hypothetical protein